MKIDYETAFLPNTRRWTASTADYLPDTYEWLSSEPMPTEGAAVLNLLHHLKQESDAYELGDKVQPPAGDF